jgi:membrane protein implicated in regulation of membrane protease activity
MMWWMWVVLGVLLLVVEFSTPGGLFALFFGIGAFVVAVAAALGATPVWQWSLFTAVSLVLLVTLRKMLLRRFTSAGPDRVDTIVGEQATALVDIPADGEGKAELRGTPWTARSATAVAIPRGARCRVERIDGLTIFLRAE